MSKNTGPELIYKQSPLDMILLIFSPLLVILLFVLIFISFTDMQEQIQFHDRLLQEGQTVYALLYKKEDKADTYGLVFQKDDMETGESDVFFVIADFLPNDFYNRLEPGARYEVRYLEAFGMFPEFFDEYRYYIPDLKLRIIIAAAAVILLSVNPRIFFLGFDVLGTKREKK